MFGRVCLGLSAAAVLALFGLVASAFLPPALVGVAMVTIASLAMAVSWRRGAQ